MDEEAKALLREIRDLLATDASRRERYVDQLREINQGQAREGRKNVLIGAVLFAALIGLGVFVGVRVALLLATPVR